MREPLYERNDLSALQVAVLRVLADAEAEMCEGEIKGELDRSWSLYPTFRALSRRRLIDELHFHWFFITDDGREALGLPRRVPALRLIEGGTNVA